MLLTDGCSVYLETSSRQIVDILKNSRQPMLAIGLSDTVRQMRAVIHSGKKSNKSVETTHFLSKKKKTAS